MIIWTFQCVIEEVWTDQKWSYFLFQIYQWVLTH